VPEPSVPVPELIVQACRAGHDELRSWHNRPGWGATQRAITGRPHLPSSPHSESPQRTGTPDATSRSRSKDQHSNNTDKTVLLGIWWHRCYDDHASRMISQNADELV